MVQSLVFLGVIPPFGTGGMEGRIGVRPIFRKADHPIGILFMVFVKELVRLVQFAQIPAEIQVVAVDIRDLQDGAVDFQHEHVGHGGRARFVHPVAQVVQQPMVLQQVVIDGAGGGDLVGEAPRGDARMVVALGDQLPHLREGVLPAVFHVQGDIGDLRPDHDAVFIAQIIEFLGMLIVGQAQGVGAQFPDDGHIRRVIGPGQGVALALQILMAADAPQRIAAAVEEKALFRIAVELPAAEAGADFVPAVQLRRRSVQIRVLHAVP